MKSVMPWTRAWVSRSLTGFSRHDMSVACFAAPRLELLGGLEQAIGRVGAAVEQHVLDKRRADPSGCPR